MSCRDAVRRTVAILGDVAPQYRVAVFYRVHPFGKLVVLPSVLSYRVFWLGKAVYYRVFMFSEC